MESAAVTKERNVDEEFQILADYPAERKKLPADSDSEDDEEESCEHEGVETDEDFSVALIYPAFTNQTSTGTSMLFWIGNTPTRIAS